MPAPIEIDGPHRRPVSPLSVVVGTALVVLLCLGAVHVFVSIVEAMP